MKIAISGTIGSGKSEAVAYLRKKGYPVFDCDEENRLLLEKGNEGYRKVKKAFRDCFEGDELDKQKLADRIFNDPKARLKLEGIMHPLILQKLSERKEDPLFAEVPLLFEAGWEGYFDHNLLLVSDDEKVKERLKIRGYSDEEILRRINSQFPAAEKIKRAEKIIYNNGSLKDLYVLIDEWLQEVL